MVLHWLLMFSPEIPPVCAHISALAKIGMCILSKSIIVRVRSNVYSVVFLFANPFCPISYSTCEHANLRECKFVVFFRQRPKKITRQFCFFLHAVRNSSLFLSYFSKVRFFWIFCMCLKNCLKMVTVLTLGKQ